ncbi:Hypothetical protein mma_2214 [Janthinobacterium sp. Marseille]|nr:helix-turn-helix domain-containing protein [Janthinobacterium sp. Marseille]ABR90920.1 Hypothetical protein mma_2214 [Janthinobacterium sp. Marseille]
MKTNVAATSIAALHSFDASTLQAKEHEVMTLFLWPILYQGGKEEMTREQIAEALGWKESAVCGRVNSLVDKGWLQEKAGGITRSGRSAMLVHLPVFEQ